MDVVRKDATITNTDDDFPGSFEVVLSTGTKDRDGEEVLHTEWKQPLPDHITFDMDHKMSVEGTVGSGQPSIDDQGRLIVKGTYSSLARAQEVRTLVKEGHIRTTSVAFARSKTVKDGTTQVQRELLNGAFVAIPANTEAVVLSSKAATKAGRRNSAADQAHLDAIVQHAVALGGDATGGDTDANEDVAAAKSFRALIGAKAVAGSYEQTQSAISDALSLAYPTTGEDEYVYAYPTATFPDKVVYRVSGSSTDLGQWQADYTVNSDGTVTLGTPSRVNLVEQIVPINGDGEKAHKVTASPSSDAPATAGATEKDATVTEDDRTKQALVEAKKRFYATLSGRN